MTLFERPPLTGTLTPCQSLHRVHRNGILQNPLYASRQVWNRVRTVKDSDTGRRVSRPNPRVEWVVAEVRCWRSLRDVFKEAGRRKAERSFASSRDRKRPRHLLSGLPRCASCGAGTSTNGKDRSGRVRVRCSAHAESGSCPNPQTFYLDRIEKAVQSGLRAELRHPEVMAEYVRAYQEERMRFAADAVKGKTRIERRLASIERELDCLSSTRLATVLISSSNSNPRCWHFRTSNQDFALNSRWRRSHPKSCHCTRRRSKAMRFSLLICRPHSPKASDLAIPRPLRPCANWSTRSPSHLTPNAKGVSRLKSRGASTFSSTRRPSRMASGQCGVRW